MNNSVDSARAKPNRRTRSGTDIWEGWLASHLDRPGFCDRVAEGFGHPSADILTFVAWGMDREMRDVFVIVRGMLGAMADVEVNEA